MRLAWQALDEETTGAVALADARRSTCVAPHFNPFHATCLFKRSTRHLELGRSEREERAVEVSVVREALENGADANAREKEAFRTEALDVPEILTCKKGMTCIENH